MPKERSYLFGTVKQSTVRIWAYTAIKIKGLDMNLKNNSKCTFCNPIQITIISKETVCLSPVSSSRSNKKQPKRLEVEGRLC